MQLYILVATWFIGAAVAGLALLIPDYWTFFEVGAAGWVTVGGSTALIIYEIKKIRAEDKKKSELAEED
ncbi:MAG TPA: hypothetical protein VJP79_11650 [Nitrososphaera sp.]|nr:hypothetical protein [Nitrososphaera sp.]